MIIDNIVFLWRNRERTNCTQRFFILIAKRVFHLPKLVDLLRHSLVYRMRGAQIGRLIAFSQPRIQGNIDNLGIGDFSSIGRCEIALHEKVIIGECVVISDGVTILTASHDLADPDWRSTRGTVIIEDYAWIATNAILCPGVTIGRGAVVGAGAVVRKNIQPYEVVIGNPAVLVGARPAIAFTYRPSLLNAPFEAWIGQRRLDAA